MNGGQLGECSAMGVGDAACPPGIQSLRALTEMGSNDPRPDSLDEVIMGVETGNHAPEYQRSVYISSHQSLIGVTQALMHTALMPKRDPEFGERLRQLIASAGFKNPRRFAIDGMGWPEQAGPQRLQQYLGGRVPDIETLVQLADKLDVPLAILLGSEGVSSDADEGLKDILRHLLSLEGIADDRADTIASAFLVSQRLMRAFPDDEPLLTRAKYAARAAWIQQQHPELGT